MQAQIILSMRLQKELESIENEFVIGVKESPEYVIHQLQNFCHFIDDIPILKEKTAVELFSNVIVNRRKVAYTPILDGIILGYISLLKLEKR